MSSAQPSARTQSASSQAKPVVQARTFIAGGFPNITRIGMEESLFGDFYHFLLRTSWPRFLAIFSGIYAISNALFGVFYWLGSPCIENAQPGYLDHFFFSIQTMATIGYGKMAPITPYANALVSIEAIIGMLWISIGTGLVFARFAQSRARVLFSAKAVISKRDGVPSLIFRMANKRLNQIVEAQIRVVFAKNDKTLEGEPLRRFVDLEMVRSQNAFFAISWTAVHPITEKSPLYGQTTESLTKMGAEITISLVGIDEHSSQTVHARHSYIPADFCWNERFADIISVTPEGRRIIDYRRFHDTLPLLDQDPQRA